jgi:hypothetical protein
MYLLGLLTAIPSRNKMIAERVREGYVPLHAQTMQGHVRHYNYYLSYLVRVGVIETNGSFRRGAPSTPGESRTYRYTSLYSGQPVRLEKIRDAKLRRKLKKERAEGMRELSLAHGHLAHWLEPNGSLQIDEVGARQFADRRLQLQQEHPVLLKQKQRTKRKPHKRNQLQTEYSDPMEQRRHAEYNIQCFEEQDLRASVDSRVGRLHSTLTNMSGALRNFVTYEGQTLVSIDIANSQPYLANVLLRPEFYEELSTSKPKPSRKIDVKNRLREGERRAQNTVGVQSCSLRYGKEGNKVKEEREGRGEEDPYTTLVKMGQMLDGEDVEMFAKLTSSGELYEYLRDAFGRELGAQYGTKENAKVAIFEVLFAGNGYNSKMKSVFQKLFPTVALVFHVFKRGDKTILPRLLQMLEAHIILQAVTTRIAKASHGKIPLFTVHDSIVTTQKYQDHVRGIMEEELTRFVGLPPTLKVDVWSASNADLLLSKWEQKAGVTKFGIAA